MTAITHRPRRNRLGSSKNAGLKFMPMIPASTTAGGTPPRQGSSTFMTSLARWAARPM